MMSGFYGGENDSAGAMPVLGLITSGNVGRFSFHTLLDGVVTKDTYVTPFDYIFDEIEILTEPSHDGNLTVGQKISGQPQVNLKVKSTQNNGLMPCVLLENWVVQASVVPANCVMSGIDKYDCEGGWTGVWPQNDVGQSPYWSMTGEGQSLPSSASGYGGNCSCIDTDTCTSKDLASGTTVSWDDFRISAVGSASAGPVEYKVVFTLVRKGAAAPC